MKPDFIAFSDRGKELADRLAAELGGTAFRCGEELSLREWVEDRFPSSEGLVFVGAAGIAVRAIAPYVRSKASDPAVVVVDERGCYAIPLLGGHLGGANALARRIAAVCGAEAVITTATDRNGVFAVDEWAKAQGCVIPAPGGIKAVSAALLAGKEVPVRSDWSIPGDPPAGICLTASGSCGVRLSLRKEDCGLAVVPRILVLGVGCRRGTRAEQFEAFFSAFMARHGFYEAGVLRVCSISLKAEEPGLLEFCRNRKLEFRTFPAEELAALPGTFTASERVLQVTGVDNVCERSAVLGSGGTLLCRKEAGDGITMALAVSPFHPTWRWTYE